MTCNVLKIWLSCSINISKMDSGYHTMPPFHAMSGCKIMSNSLHCSFIITRSIFSRTVKRAFISVSSDCVVTLPIARWSWKFCVFHYSDVIMSTMASQITSLTFVCSTVYSGADKRKHQSSASPGNSPVTDEFPAQRASNAENASIWRRHHVIVISLCGPNPTFFVV